MYQNTGHHLVSFKPQRPVTLHSSLHPPLRCPVSHPKVASGAKAAQKTKSTKSKTQPVAGTESSSSEESDASSESKLTELDEEEPSDQDDEDFALNISDDALGDLLAQEVCNDKHKALFLIYIYY